MSGKDIKEIQNAIVEKNRVLKSLQGDSNEARMMKTAVKSELDRLLFLYLKHFKNLKVTG